VTVGVDDTSGGVETVEDQPPADRPPPPPPPDQPGAEPEGIPSRADSRAAAAAATKPDTSQPADAKPEPSTEPESQSVSSDRLDGSVQETSGERETAVMVSTTDEQLAARDIEPEPLDGLGAFDGGAEQSSTLTTSPTEDAPIDDERALTTFEAIDHPAPSDQEIADVDEIAAPMATGDSPPFDDPGNEPEGLPSRADSRTGAAAANGELVAQPTTDNTSGPPEQANDMAPPLEIQSTPADEMSQPEPDKLVADTAEQQTADDWPWADEFAARAQSRENPAAANAEHSQPAFDQRSTDDAPTVPEIGEEQQLTAEKHTANRDLQTETPEPGGENHGQGPQDVTDNGPKDLGLTVGDKAVREHIDPAGAGIGEQPEGHKERFERQARDNDASWADGIDRLSDLPTGEELVEPKPEDDDSSRAERLRKNFFRDSGDYQDSVKKNITISHDAFQRPPAGHPEIKVCREDPVAPVVASMPQHSVDIATATANALIISAVFGEGIRRIRERHMKGGER
jgi:hypothetical protein